jgi:hypothetical protein
MPLPPHADLEILVAALTAPSRRRVRCESPAIRLRDNPAAVTGGGRRGEQLRDMGRGQVGKCLQRGGENSRSANRSRSTCRANPSQPMTGVEPAGRPTRGSRYGDADIIARPALNFR